MTIAEAKQVRIVDFLAQLGHHAQHIKSEQYWYFSPLRNERTQAPLPDGQRERGIGVYREACEWRISTENPYADRSTPTGGG